MLKPVSKLLSLYVVLFSASCHMSPGSGNIKEHESKPNPYDEGPTGTSAAKTTGVTALTNVKEIGMFNTSGRITCMVIDKANPNHMIAGAATGGLWESNNAGVTWKVIDDHLPSLQITSISQNPFQTNVFYASTYTFMPTTPGGTTYRPDIYKSTDGGKTFQLLPTSAGNFSGIQKVVCSPADANTVYALSDQMGGKRGVYKSTNNAQSFTLVHSTNDNGTDLEVFPDGSVLVSAGTGVFRSPNGNNGTFTAVTGLNGVNTFANINMTYCEGQPNNVYAVSTGGNSGVGVFKSTNGGQSWSFAQSIPTGVFTRAVGIKPNNPAFVFAGSVNLYLTQNSGNSFAHYSVGGVDYWSINFHPQNPDRVLITKDAGIVEVNLNPFNPNGNTAYVKRDSLLNSAQIYNGDYFVTGDKVIAGMQDLGTGQVWNGTRVNVASGDGGYCFFHKQDTTIAYGSYQNGGLFKKTKINIQFPNPGYTQPIDILNQLDANNDGDVDEGAFFIHGFWMNNADGEQLYMPTRRRLWRSVNGGNSWQPISGYYNLTVPNTGVLTITGNNKANPIVYWTNIDTLMIMPNAKTATAGNELRIKMPMKMRSIRIDPANDSIVYVTANVNTSGPRIFRSSNLFKPNVQWTDLTGDMPVDLAVHTFEINPLDANQMVVGTGCGLYISTDGGQHWEQDLQLPNVNILRLSVRPSDNRIFIFTYGRGAWAASFPKSNSIQEPESAQSLLAVWPNPTQGVIHVGVPKITAGTSIQVWATDGKLQKTINNLQHTPQAVNLGDLPPGTYLVAVMEGNKRTQTARVVKY